MSELLPCPFCGSPAALSFSRDGETCNVRCSKWSVGTCLGAGPNCYDRKEAAVGWNRRAAVAAQPEAGEAVGWKRVPVEPTQEMIDAGCEVEAREIALADNRRRFETAAVPLHSDFSTAGQELRIRYAAMLASAPTIQPTQPVQPEQCPICFSFEPYTGTCGSNDPRALCKRATAQAGDAGEPSDKERLDVFFAMHAAELESNPYAYCELAYTRATGWMAWITDKPLAVVVVSPDRKVLTSGQGDTPAEAAHAAIRAAKESKS